MARINKGVDHFDVACGSFKWPGGTWMWPHGTLKKSAWKELIKHIQCSDVLVQCE